MVAHSRRAKFGYAVAAGPAAFLPLSYVICVGWAMWWIIPELLGGGGAPEGKPPEILGLLVVAGLYATFVQWPIYLIWAAFSRELTIRIRLLWILILILLNMFAIPWFLYCKYHGTAQIVLQRRIQREIMNDPKRLKTVIIGLMLVLFALVFALGHTLEQNFLWKMRVDSLADYEGVTRASHDFQAGKLRLFVISGERDHDNFSGTNDGPFEIWFPQYYPKVYSLRFSTERMAAAYNSRMRCLQAHSGKVLTESNTSKLH